MPRRELHGVRTTVVESQPPRLTRADTKSEAERMGALDREAPLLPREVATSHREFNAMRRRYEQRMSDLRRQYMGEWEARKERENALLQGRLAQWRMSRASAKALGARARAERMAAHTKRQGRLKQARTVRQEMSRRRQSLWLLQVDRRRQAWLDDLEASSQEWILEEDIDARITPELFSSMRIPWQYEEWFSRVAKARAKTEAHLRHTAATSAAKAAGEDADQVGSGAVEMSEWEQDLDGWVSDGSRAAASGARYGDTYDQGDVLELEDDIEPAELVRGMDRAELRRSRAMELRGYASKHLMAGETVLGPDSFSVVPAALVEEIGESGLIENVFFSVPDGGGPDSAEESMHRMKDRDPRDERSEDAMIDELMPALLRDAGQDDPSLTALQQTERAFAVLTASTIGPRFVARAKELARERAEHVEVTGSASAAQGVFVLNREAASDVTRILAEEFLPQVSGVELDSHTALLARWLYRSLDAVGLTASRMDEADSDGEAESPAGGRAGAGAGAGAGDDSDSGDSSSGTAENDDVSFADLHRSATKVGQVLKDGSLPGDKPEPWAEGQAELADAVLEALEDGNLLAASVEAQVQRLDPAGRFSRLAAPDEAGGDALAGSVDIERGLPWELDATVDPEAADDWLRLATEAHEAGTDVTEEQARAIKQRMLSAHHEQQLDEFYRARRAHESNTASDALPPAAITPVAETSDTAARVSAASNLARDRQAEATEARERPYARPAVPRRPGPHGALEPGPGVLPLLVDDALDLAEETEIFDAHSRGNTAQLRRLLERRTRRLEREAPEVLARYDVDAPYRGALQAARGAQTAEAPGATEATGGAAAAGGLAVDPSTYDEDFSLFSDEEESNVAAVVVGEEDEEVVVAEAEGAKRV